MNIFEIIGPVMVGPSSSHTAGAVRIGFVARNLLGEEVKEAEILLYGSFLATGRGHGTDRALVGGLMGMKPDDYRIPNSIEIAKERGIKLRFGEAILKEGHPNSALLRLKGESGKKLEIIGESLGGGRINIAQIDGIETNFSGENPTLIVHNLDQPGHVSEVTAMLAHSGKGGRAVMVVECDQEIPEEGIRWLERVEGILKVTYLKKAEDE